MNVDSMSHPDDQQLVDFLSDQLDAQQSIRIDSHIGECETCQRRLDEVLRDESLAASWSRAETTITSDRTESRHEPVAFDAGSHLIVRGEIARGGMGVVYRGFDRELKREVAIKVAITDDRGFHSVRFYREAQISGQLQHPGVVPVHEIGRLRDGRQYISMKLVDGQTLHSLIHSGDGEQNRVQELDAFSQICQTMAYAHSRDIIHRDLKPANVMVGAFGEVQIMDWGIARRVGTSADSEADSDAESMSFSDSTKGQLRSTKPIRPDATRSGTADGTPAYMPPEQAAGDRADKRSDVFTIGGILFEILTRKAPFDQPTATMAFAESLGSNLESAFCILDNIDADNELVEITRQCLSANPDERPRDAEVVNQTFNEYLANRERRLHEAVLEKARAEERLVAERKRNRILIWSSTAILGFLLLSAVAGWFYLHERNARITERAKAEKKQLQSRQLREKQILDHMSKARHFQRMAVEADNVQRSELWTRSLIEIRNGNGLISESINPALKSELRDMGAEIEAQAATLAAKTQRLQYEKEYENALRECINRRYYPLELINLNPPELISDSLEVAYANLGITPDTDLKDSSQIILDSLIRDQLIRGLMMWVRSLEKQQASDQELIKWLNNLHARVDIEPFRLELQELLREQKTAEVVKLCEKQEACSSLLNIYACSRELKRLGENAALYQFLRRAHKRFSGDFVLNWDLAMSTNWDPSTTLAHRQAAYQHLIVCYSLEPENPVVMMNLSGELMAQHQFHPAIEVLEKLTQLFPEYPSGFAQLAMCYRSLGDDEKTLLNCEKTLRIEPDSPYTLAVRGMLMHKQNKPQEALSDLLKARRIANNKSVIHSALAQTYFALKRFDEAIASMKTAIKLEPQSAETRFALADLYARSDQLDLAAQTYRESIPMRPKLPVPIAALANVLLKDGKAEEAESIIRDAVINGINSQAMQIVLAKACISNGKKEEATTILSTLVESNPQMKEPKRILASLEEQ